MPLFLDLQGILYPFKASAPPITPIVFAGLVKLQVAITLERLAKCINPRHSHPGRIEPVRPALQEPPTSLLEFLHLGNRAGIPQKAPVRTHQQAILDAARPSLRIDNHADGPIRDPDEGHAFHRRFPYSRHGIKRTIHNSHHGRRGPVIFATSGSAHHDSRGVQFGKVVTSDKALLAIPASHPAMEPDKDWRIGRGLRPPDADCAFNTGNIYRQGIFRAPRPRANTGDQKDGATSPKKGITHHPLTELSSTARCRRL